MRLSAEQAKRVEDEFGVETIEEDHPIFPKLQEVFGDHTFVMDSEGLNIIEPESSDESANGRVVRLASWSDDKSALNVHEPQVLPVNVNLQAGE